MKLRLTVILLVVFAILISGCGKNKKEEEKTAESETPVTTTTTTTQQVPEINTAKVKQAIGAFPDFSSKIKEISSQDVPTTQEDMEAMQKKNLDEMETFAKSKGFDNMQDFYTYMSVIIYLYQLHETANNLDSLLAQLPAEQRESDETKQGVEELKKKYAEAKVTYGDSIFNIVINNKSKIETFFLEQQQIQAQQMSKFGQPQAQVQPAQQAAAQKTTQAPPPTPQPTSKKVKKTK